MTVGYFRSVMSIMETGLDCSFLVTEGESLVTRARNNLVSTFMQSGFDTLAFIDADIEIDGKDFINLVKLEGVRGAAVNMKRQDQLECLSCFRDGQVKRADMPDEPFEVDHLGAAVLLIDRSVFENLYECYSDRSYVDPIVGPGVALFEQVIVDNTYLSEDYGFCRLLKAQGIPIICDPSVIVSHYGQGVWRA